MRHSRELSRGRHPSSGGGVSLTDQLTMPLADPIAGAVRKRIAFGADPTGCWLWQGTTDKDGYPLLTVWRDGRSVSVRVHRWMYEQWIAPIPEGLVIDHCCRVRHCVNPLHLEPVTIRENVRRAATTPVAQLMAKECCDCGRPFDRIDRRGKRICSTCRREKRRAKDGSVSRAEYVAKRRAGET